MAKARFYIKHTDFPPGWMVMDRQQTPHSLVHHYPSRDEARAHMEDLNLGITKELRERISARRTYKPKEMDDDC